MGCGVWGLGFSVYGLGFRVQGLGFGNNDVEEAVAPPLRVVEAFPGEGRRWEAPGIWRRVSGFRFQGSGLGFRVWGSEFRIKGLGFVV